MYTLVLVVHTLVLVVHTLVSGAYSSPSGAYSSTNGAYSSLMVHTLVLVVHTIVVHALVLGLHTLVLLVHTLSSVAYFSPSDAYSNLVVHTIVVHTLILVVHTLVLVVHTLNQPLYFDLQTPFNSADSKPKDNLISQDNPPLHSLPGGEIYIKVVYPYVPPKIDVVYYSPSKPSTTLPVDAKDLEHKSEVKSELSVVKMPIVTRAYSSIESTYTEEPLSYVDTEKPLCIVYEAPVMTAKWEEVNKVDEKVNKVDEKVIKEVESPPVPSPELHSSPEINDGLHGSLSEEVKIVEKEITKIAPNVNPSDGSESSSSKLMDDSKSHNGHVEGSVSSEVRIWKDVYIKRKQLPYYSPVHFNALNCAVFCS
ncbi:hypothetical protein CHS0354_015184 [Potamilus streckersoni]|uniref:Uncharacterized protein n=1 Tax=Potamilus streckersoni TaxID=2493646 RepID=A0AAE0VT55_9BIVA|nr:hypothetical protein CHS0354_015184 [Potamilus streckersoni]